MPAVIQLDAIHAGKLMLHEQKAAVVGHIGYDFRAQASRLLDVLYQRAQAGPLHAHDIEVFYLSCVLR
jgi:hypothetical protein